MNIVSFILGAAMKPKRQSQRLVAVRGEIESLRAHYNKHIEPLTRKFENRRVACLKVIRQRIYMSVIIFSVIVLVVYLFDIRQRLDIP